MRDISLAGEVAINAGRLKQGHLISLELPSMVLHITDYMRDVTFNGITYLSGRVKQISSYTKLGI